MEHGGPVKAPSSGRPEARTSSAGTLAPAVRSAAEGLRLMALARHTRAALIVLGADAEGDPPAVVALATDSADARDEHGLPFGFRGDILTTVRQAFEGHLPRWSPPPGWQLVPWAAAGRRGALALEGDDEDAIATAGWLRQALALGGADEVLAAEGAAIVLADSAGSVVAASSGAPALLGAGDGRLLGQPLQEVFGGPGVARLDRTEPSEVILTPLTGAGGQPLMARAERLSGGEVAVHVARAEAHARRALRRDQWVAGVRHEVRTPLTVLRGVTAMLEEEPDMEVSDRVGFLASLRRETLRVITFVEDLLTLARLDAARPLARLAPVDLLAWVHEIANEFRPFCAEHAIDFAVAVPATPLHVLAERSLLDQLGRSLIGHALRAAPTGTAVAVRLAPAGSLAVLTVEDDGPGLSGADADDAFTTFRRSTATGKYAPGVGVGLTVAKRIADAHHWALVHVPHGRLNRLELRAPTTPDRP